MTNAQERARERAWNLVMNMNLEEAGGVDRAVSSVLAFAAQVEAETWERAANVATEVRQSEMTGLHNMHYIDACDAILEKISELYQ